MEISLKSGTLTKAENFLIWLFLQEFVTFVARAASELKKYILQLSGGFSIFTLIDRVSHIM